MTGGTSSALRAIARMSVRRSRSDVGALTAALLTAVIAVAAVAVAPVYTSAVARSGLQSELEATTGTEGGVRVATTRRGADYVETDRAVTSVLAAVQQPAGGAVTRVGRSGSYDLPADVAGRVATSTAAATDVITSFAFVEGIEQAARLDRGRWPQPVAGPTPEAALPRAAATLLDVSPGEVVELRDRSTGDIQRTRVVGTYAARDEAAPIWFGDRLLTAGVDAGSFTAVGPFVLDPDAFLTTFADTRTTAEWRLTPPPDDITLGDVDPLRSAIAALPGRLAAATDGSAPTVDSGLPRLLGDASAALTRARSGVLLPVVQLAVLAAVALLLIAGLLSHRRARDTRLLVARGVTPVHVLGLALTDAAVLVLPAVVLGPLVAAAAVRALDDVGPLAATGLQLSPAISSTTWLLAAATAAACAVTLALPTWLHARRLAAPERGARGRTRRVLPGLAQRANADLALLLVAAVGLWQLRRYGGAVVTDDSGATGVDPLLVAGPALGLVAGGVLLLRSVPLVARGADRLVAGGRGISGALTGWQLARRTGRWSRPVLLLSLATATAAFGAAYGTTWSDAQRDRAGFASGADLRVVPRGQLAALPTGAQAAAYADLPGVDAVLPVRRLSGYVPAETDTATVLAVDTAQLPAVMDLRADLSERPLPELVRELRDTADEAPALPLPGTPERIVVDAALTPSDARPRTPVVSLVLRDAAGLVLRLPGRTLPEDGAVHRLAWDLATELPTGTSVAPAAPLSVVALELATTTGTVWIGGAPVAAPAGTDRFVVRSLRAGTDTELQPVAPPEEWTGAISAQSAAAVEPQLAVVDVPESLVAATVERSPGFRGDAATVTLTPGRPAPAARALPAVATARFLDRTGSAVGDTVRVRVGGVDGVRIVGQVAELPTTGDTGLGGLLVDLAALDSRDFAATGSVTPTTEVWLSTSGDSDATARALTDPPYDAASVISRATLTDELLRDPIGAGLVGALVLSVVAALIFAVLGYAAAAATAVRDRTAESSLLRALGVPPPAMARGLAGEHAVVIGIGLAAGLALGVLLALLVLPQSMPSGAGVAALPDVRVVIPWPALAALAAAVAFALALVVAGLVVRTARGPAAALAPDGEVVG